jgi:glucosylceramidase
MNTNGKIAVIVMNPTDEKFSYRMYIGNKAVVETSLPHSIATLVF